MKKYLKVISMGLQTNFIYRYNYFIYVISEFIPVIVTIILWKAILASSGQDSIKGYTEIRMISYFLFITIIRELVGLWFLDYEITDEIRNGLINRYLLRPISYMGYRFSLTLARKIIYGISLIFIFGIGFYFLRNYLLPPSQLKIIPLVFLCTFLGLVMNFLLTYSAGLIGFWLLEVSSLFFIFYILNFMLSGALFPLDLLPKPIFLVMQLLPFQYMGFFQMKLYLGDYSFQKGIEGISILMLWIISFWFITQWLWKKGTRRYSAYGG